MIARPCFTAPCASRIMPRIALAEAERSTTIAPYLRTAHPQSGILASSRFNTMAGAPRMRCSSIVSNIAWCLAG